MAADSNGDDRSYIVITTIIRYYQLSKRVVTRVSYWLAEAHVYVVVSLLVDDEVNELVSMLIRGTSILDPLSNITSPLSERASVSSTVAGVIGDVERSVKKCPFSFVPWPWSGSSGLETPAFGTSNDCCNLPTNIASAAFSQCVGVRLEKKKIVNFHETRIQMIELVYY